MYSSTRRSSENQLNDTFHKIYVPLLRFSLNISTIKYICLFVYCIRSMQDHLSAPIYCRNASDAFLCSASTCQWIHTITQNLPRFLLAEWMLVEQCAYLLVAFLISCALFLYSVYLVKKETDLRIRYRAILTFPSLFFELLMTFLLYYSTITSIDQYSKTARTNPNYHSTAFIIFAFIISCFYAIMLVIHFATLYYMMIYPITPLTSPYTLSNANYSQMNYGPLGVGSNGSGGRSQHYEAMQPPLLADSYRLSVNNWQAANETRGTVSTYSHVRSWNNTLRSTATSRNQRAALCDDDNDYLELI